MTETIMQQLDAEQEQRNVRWDEIVERMKRNNEKLAAIVESFEGSVVMLEGVNASLRRRLGVPEPRPDLEVIEGGRDDDA